MTEELQYEVSEKIAQIRINRPKALNAIHPRIMRPLSALMRQADEDPDVQVVILSGAGEHFGAGYDLKADWGSLYGDRSIMGARKMLAACVEFEYSRGIAPNRALPWCVDIVWPGVASWR